MILHQKSKKLSQKENLKTKKLYFELFKIAQYKTGNEFRKSQLFDFLLMNDCFISVKFQ